MNRFGRKSLLIVGLFGALSYGEPEVKAQKNLDVCRVTTDTRSIKEGYGTGIYEVGKFPVDDIEDTTKKSFLYETIGNAFSVDVEVEYGDFKAVEKGKPTEIVLSLLVRLTGNQNTTPEVTAVQAGTTYRHKWGTVYVSKDVLIGGIAQHFQFTCSDGLSKGGIQRGEPKWLKKNKH